MSLLFLLFHLEENSPGKLVAALKIHAYRVSTLIVNFGDKVDALCSVLVPRNKVLHQMETDTHLKVDSFGLFSLTLLIRVLCTFSIVTHFESQKCTEVGMVIAFLACWEMALAMLLAIPIFGVAQGRLMQTDANCLKCLGGGSPES